MLPAPQRRALGVALLRIEPDGMSPESRAIALGFLHVVRALAARAPVLIAIDDVHWLDPSSRDALTFACRRLAEDDVRLLLSRRPAPASPLEHACRPGSLELLEVGPLSLGALRHLLQERLGLVLSRQMLRQLVEATVGNPLFALEVGRLLVEHGLPAPGEDLPVPDAVEDVLGTRVARLPAPIRRLLIAVSLNADLGTTELARLADEAVLESAVADGVLVVDGERVRASHPLLAAAGRARARDGGAAAPSGVGRARRRRGAQSAAPGAGSPGAGRGAGRDCRERRRDGIRSRRSPGGGRARRPRVASDAGRVARTERPSARARRLSVDSR
jgi:hypothetical protein